MKKNHKIIISIAILILIAIITLYIQTGFLQAQSINKRDLSKWTYDSDGIIENTKEFTLQGSNETCWYLIHGYTSTPDEMTELAQTINNEFNETVVVTRLKGHSQTPSQILNLSLEDWYNQVDQETDTLKETCNKINIIGISFGGTLATRLAEEKNLNNIYLLAPYLKTPYKFYYILKPETYLETFGPIMHYSKKTKIAQINSPEELDKHIAYWNLPFEPVLNSKDFIKQTKENLNKIEEPLLIQHSKNDKTSDVETSKTILEKSSSKTKELILFEKSNHIIIEDYDKEEIMQNIIEFEKKTRNT
ncbi:MAG: alpha/beta hydrolase [Nanoarchaeota archaeon]|nr:alpha/beta hydrolase [Nanoarchaeota archaeon]